MSCLCFSSYLIYGNFNTVHRPLSNDLVRFLKFFVYSSKEELPTIQESTIVIVDSVINTGRSLLKVIEKLKAANQNVEIIIVANVIQEKALPLLQDYKVYAIRVSSNAFKGMNQATQKGNTGPDTADRLFNLITTQ